MRTNQEYDISRLRFEQQLGTGSFGTVFKAIDLNTMKVVAVKRTQKSGCLVPREFQILQSVSGSKYCVQLLDIFYTVTEQDKCLQHLVFEYLPENLSRFIRARFKAGRPLGYSEISEIFSQILKGIEFIHSKNVVHRDLKPENILIDPNTLQIKICDFGSAKRIDELNTPYIVSRYYRAPELIFCNTHYSNKIDIWSAGCIFVELFTGFPLFTGKSEGDQFIKQAQILGPPTVEELKSLLGDTNLSSSATLAALSIKKKGRFAELFKNCPVPEVACELALSMLQYTPDKRCPISELLCHQFFLLK